MNEATSTATGSAPASGATSSAPAGSSSPSTPANKTSKATPAAAPESPEEARQRRQESLDEAAKVIGTDLRNSCDQVTSFCIHGNTGHVKTSWDLLVERFNRAKGLIKKALE